MEAAEKIKSRWTRSFLTATDIRNEEEKYICDICQRDLGNPSNLNLHRNTHVIERRFKCQPCQMSFSTEGDLQKHLRSALHESRSAKTEAFGIPTVDNPRPYRCPHCAIKSFTKHGHLAKHLRSKLHIQNLEAKGLIPAGTYVLLEKSGPELRESIDTTTNESSLESLQSMAKTLFSDVDREVDVDVDVESLMDTSTDS